MGINFNRGGNAPVAAANYPLIKQGKETGMIVLFTAPKTGTIIAGNDYGRPHQVPGYTSNRWVETGFETLPVGETVELFNE